jgi:hypothetical protein
LPKTDESSWAPALFFASARMASAKLASLASSAASRQRARPIAAADGSAGGGSVSKTEREENGTGITRRP